jgi:hypothetical protein
MTSAPYNARCMALPTIFDRLYRNAAAVAILRARIGADSTATHNKGIFASYRYRLIDGTG